MRAVLLLSLALLGCATDAADPSNDTTPATGTATDTAPPATTTANTGGTVELRTIASGAYAAAQPQGPSTVVIRTASDYPAMWQQVVGGGEPPRVDFAKETVVILLAGSKPTGGWSVEPKGVRVEGNRLVVDAAVKGPPADAMVTQAFTSPFAAIAVSAKNFDDVTWNP